MISIEVYLMNPTGGGGFPMILDGQRKYPFVVGQEFEVPESVVNANAGLDYATLRVERIREHVDGSGAVTLWQAFVEQFPELPG